MKYKASPCGARLLRGAAIVWLLLPPPFLFGAQTRIRSEVRFPDLPGYVTLKCDFHMHTVFSDGEVWPTVRVEEAWRQGLDAIAITDHLEYTPHKADVSTNSSRSYELAKANAAALNLILIRAAEITRGEPPGHLNALFLDGIEPLRTTNAWEAVKAAAAQGAFIFWNHPGWKQPNRKSVWYKEQGEFYDQGWLKGLEIVNGSSYDPIVHRWCLQKKLTMLADSDVHGPILMGMDPAAGEHRPMTLVFATERSAGAIKEALFSQRTAVYTQNLLIGEEAFLSPLFHRSIQVKNPEVTITGKGSALVQIYNQSSIPIELVARGVTKEVTIPAKLALYPEKTVLLELRGKTNNLSGTREIALPFSASNFQVRPRKALPVEIKVKVMFTPKV